MRKLVAAGVVWWLAVGWIGPVHAARRALLVGMNTYKDSRISKLKGCENDCRALADMLKAKLGFASADIHTLYSRKATADAVKREFQRWLVDGSKPGDVVVFLFSGHGSQRKDSSGDEPDGRDEIICCADYNPKTQTGCIADDDLRTMLKALAGRNVTLLFDSCHSGSMTKNLDSKSVVRPDRIDVDTVQRKWIEPPAEVLAIPRTKALTKGGGVIDDPELDHVLFSACMAGETAADAAFFEGGRRTRHGAFMYMFLKGLGGPADADGDGRVTNKEVLEFVTDKLRQSNYSFTQTPELSTRGLYVDRPVFSGIYEPGGGWRVVHRQAGRATINRGSAHGVTPAAEFDAYVKQAGSTRTVGSFQATDVLAHASSGPLRLAATVAPSTVLWVRQKSYQVPPGSDRLRVFFKPMDGQDAGQKPPPALVEVVRSNPRLTVADRADTADRIVTWRAKGGAGGGAVAFAVAGRYGRVERRFVGSQTDAVGVLRKALRRAWVLKKLSLLENPRPSFRVQVSVAGGRRDFRMGDEIRFQFTATRDCYLTLLTVDSEGTIAKLFPNQWQRDNRIVRGRLYRFPPDRARFHFSAKPPPGRDVLVAVATEKRVQVNVTEGDDPVRIVQQVTDGLKGIAVGASKARPGADTLPTEGWSSASLTIETFDK